MTTPTKLTIEDIIDAIKVSDDPVGNALLVVGAMLAFVATERGDEFVMKTLQSFIEQGKAQQNGHS
ncbi:hypothetical protein GOC14_06885 [Sinorhizobium meliloti]|nr:hypothetical protein [Sinorhizobium meliloti]